MKSWALELLAARKESRIDKVPAGWKTLEQVAKEMDMTKQGVREIIAPLLGKKVERKKFRVELPGGSVRMTYHYKLK